MRTRPIVAALLAAALAVPVAACGPSRPRRPAPRPTLNQTCFPGYRVAVINRDRHTCRGDGIRRGTRVDRRPTCGTGYALEAGTRRYRSGRLVRYGCLRVGATD